MSWMPSFALNSSRSPSLTFAFSLKRTDLSISKQMRSKSFGLK